MKFHQLRPGTRFEYEGTLYVKISPLRGVSEADGSQRLIARSAQVTLPDELCRTVADKLPERRAGAQVQAELEKFVAACELAATRLTPPLIDSQRDQLREVAGDIQYLSHH